MATPQTIADSDALIFYCNGNKIVEKQPDPSMSLGNYIRNTLQLTGCKIGCGSGGCGACTVMVSSVEETSQNISHISVNGCLYPLCAAYGKAVTTVEGIGSTKTKLHPVQERLAKAHGSQCGFCSPGMVMSMYTLLRNNPKPTSEDILAAMEGNLCRCTGYRPILDAFKTFTEAGCCKEMKGQKCCQNRESGMSDQLYVTSDFIEYDPTQDIIFPPELLMTHQSLLKTLKFCRDNLTWITAASLDDILQIKANNTNTLIVAGNTSAGALNHGGVVTYAGHVPELCGITFTDNGIKIGANITMSQIKNMTMRSDVTDNQARTLAVIKQAMKQFASNQIRNVATIGGHVSSPSADYDLIPLLMALGAKIEIAETDGNVRKIPLNEEAYSSDGSVVKANEIIISIEIPFIGDNEYVQFYKMTRRRYYNDSAVINAALLVTFDSTGNDVIKDCRLVFGRLHNIPVFATETATSMIGRSWNPELVNLTCNSLKQEFEHHIEDSDHSRNYCQDLIAASFFKFFWCIFQSLGKDQENVAENYTKQEDLLGVPDAIPRGAALFQPVPEDQPDIDPIGRPIVHHSAFQQTSGEAVFVDDLASVKGELYLAFVLPSRGRAKILSVSLEEAQKVDGWVTYVSADDIPGENKSLFEDEIMATDQVYSTGHIIGAVVASSSEAAEKAASLVQVSYENLPAIMTIEEAIEQDAIYQPQLYLAKGNTEEGFKESPMITEGTIRTSAQEHFYMEPNTCIAIPSGEADEMKLRVCSQDINTVQKAVAKGLGVDVNKINVRSKRCGGSFGGKANQCAYLVACAVAAKNSLRRPLFLGMRPGDLYLTKHFDNGLGSELRRAGDLETPTVYFDISIQEKILYSIDSVYNFDNISARVKNCATNKPGAKPLRTFGTVDSVFIIESIMTDVARRCCLAPDQVREVNMHKADIPTTYYGLSINDFNVFKRCWQQCLEASDFHNRREMVIDLNSKSRWSKRGIAVVPLRFDVGSFPFPMQQAGALLNAYLDGSVLIYHCGAEVGQGIHTKMIQIASRVLDIPIEKIHVAENNAHVVPHASDTAASYGTDLNGMAVKNACEILQDRIAPFKTDNPNGTFADWVSAAYANRVSLSVIGHYEAPGIDWSWETKTGRPFPYSAFGAACSEVQIDCLTGNHQLLRTDIVMDVGKSLNPALDVGQIEGAFMMGYGYFTMEELLWDKDGTLLTNGPLNYKIPCVRDIPAEFNITLLRDCPNPKAVYSSKGVGEPALCLASSVHFAIQDAIQSARGDAGITGVFLLDAPATADKIRRLCGEIKSK